MEFNSLNRDKFNGATVDISRNNDRINASNTGAFIESRAKPDAYFVIALEDIDGVIDALKSVQRDYEAMKPRNSDILNALPIGSVVQIANEHTRWFKGADGHWSNTGQRREGWIPGGYAGEWFNHEHWDINVKYNPNEEAN